MASFSYLALEQAQIHSSSRGRAYIWHPTPHLIVTRAEGVLTAEAASFFDTVTRRFVERDVRHTAFSDWWELTGYDDEARTKLTILGRDIHQMTDSTHILVQSKVVAFGVRAANLIL